MAGSRHAFLPRYSPAALLATLSQRRVTATIAVPAMLVDLVAAAARSHGLAEGVTREASGAHTQGNAERAPATLPHLRRVLVGAGALDDGVTQQLRAVMPNALVLGAYGMTECASSITFQTLLQPPHAIGAPARVCVEASVPAAGCELEAVADSRPNGVSVGRAAPGVQLALAPLPAAVDAVAAGVKSAEVRSHARAVEVMFGCCNVHHGPIGPSPARATGT